MCSAEKTNSNQKIEVIRSSGMRPEELHQLLRAGKIAVVKGQLNQWTSGKMWNLSYFRKQYPEKVLRIRGGSRLHWKTLCRVSFKDYVDFLTGARTNRDLLSWEGANPYAAFNAIPEGDNDVNFEGMVPKYYKSWGTMLWLGPDKSMTPTHFDDSGITLLGQISGRKRFTFYPEEQSEFLYPSDVFDFMAVFSSVDIDRPDLKRFPKFKHATPTVVDLEPGEIIAFPARMWHQVQAAGVSLSVSARLANLDDRAEQRKIRFWYLKAFAHLLRLYKPMKCLCHIVPIHEDDLKVHSPAIKFLVNTFGRYSHEHDLADLLQWSE